MQKKRAGVLLAIMLAALVGSSAGAYIVLTIRKGHDLTARLALAGGACGTITITDDLVDADIDPCG